VVRIILFSSELKWAARDDMEMAFPLLDFRTSGSFILLTVSDWKRRGCGEVIGLEQGRQIFASK
jgi:hypothetical protein